MAIARRMYGKKICIECNSEFNVFSEFEFLNETKCWKCKRPKFECQVCGYNDYEAVHPPMSGFSVMGGKSYATHYKCMGCSVMFEDVELFSIYKKDKDLIDYKKDNKIEKIFYCPNGHSIKTTIYENWYDNRIVPLRCFKCNNVSNYQLKSGK